MTMNDHRRGQIIRVFEKFIRARIKKIRALRIDDLNINPFLIRILVSQMRLNNARSIVEWLLSQRLERGTVTSFGMALEEAAKTFSEGTGVEGADILKTREGRHYHIQVKSGPNTVPKDMAERLTQLLQSAQRRNRGSVAMFGMCYGNPDQVSSIVRQYVNVDWLSGREFWEFISGDPNCIDEVYAISADVGEKFRDKSGQTLIEVLEAKVIDLEREFIESYSESGDQMWQNLIRRNS